MDTAAEKAVVIHRANGTSMKFVESNSGLFYFETKNNSKTKLSIPNCTLVQTVEANKSHYSRHDIEGAKKARELQAILGHPPQQHFIHLLSNYLLHNCPITVAGAKLAVQISGTNVAALKGKMKKQHRGSPLSSFNPTPIPDHTTKLHKNITLGIYLFYV